MPLPPSSYCRDLYDMHPYSGMKVAPTTLMTSVTYTTLALN